MLQVFLLVAVSLSILYCTDTRRMPTEDPVHPEQRPPEQEQVDALDYEEVAGAMRWDAREVVRDEAGGPQLFIQITLRGPVFEHRALEPFARIGRATARVVEISDDGTQVRAYFDQIPPDNEPIEFGYLGDSVRYRFPENYRAALVQRLDRERLPEGTRLLKPHPN